MFIGEIPSILWGQPAPRLFLYVHGQGGSKEEAAVFSRIVTQRGYQVLSMDLPAHGQRKNRADAFDPWHVVPELKTVLEYADKRWQRISLFASSIGAWFSMLGLGSGHFEQCLWVSPVVDMKQLVARMMAWAGVSEAQLRQERIIPTDFGQTLSWDYWEYILGHPVAKWEFATWILYGEKDGLIDRGWVERFSKENDCHLTVAENCEHWFHTEKQLKILSDWVEESIFGEVL